ncbi:MAG: hypothetical protein M3279_11765 [Actinomycetota bacterium]|nr:hypothetical protein [Actinomycetota bacterium]
MAYSSWAELVAVDPEESFSSQGLEEGDPLGVPSLRLHDLETGADTLLEDGAFSLAWRGDGAVAYFKGSEAVFRVNRPFVGHVFVEDAPGAEPTQWTSKPGRYVVLAWAGDRLLAYRRLEGNSVDLVALDGPGRERVLSVSSELIAVAPGGGAALVDLESSGDSWGFGLVDIASGEVLSTLPLDGGDDSASIQSVGYNGSWVDDRAVVPADGGIAVLEIQGTSITLDGVLRFPPEYTEGVWEPRLVPGSGGGEVVVWARLGRSDDSAAGGRYQHLVCEIESGRCGAGPPQEAMTYRPVGTPDR